MTNRSVKEFNDTAVAPNPEDFIDLITSSSLERCNTIFDKVAKKIEQRLIVAITEDLLTQPEETKVLQPTKKKRKPRKRKARQARSSESSSVSTSSAVTSDDELDSVSFVTNQISYKIFSDLFRKIQENEEYADEFQIITGKVPKRKDPTTTETKSQTKRLVSKKTNKRRNKQNQPPAIKQNAPTPTARWNVDSSSSDTQSTNDEEFPPLSGSSSKIIKESQFSLHDEIVEFHDWVMKEIELLSCAKYLIFERIDNICKDLFPGCVLKLFGSQASGLALPDSDIDIAIIDAGVSSVQEGIALAYAELKSHFWVISCNAIETASVPIVKMIVKSSFFDTNVDREVKVDLTFKSQDNEIATSLQSIQYIYQLVYYQPTLPFLVMVLKTLLSKNDLSEAYGGGLSSYSLTIWVAALLSTKQSPEQADYGSLLLDFLKFYGKTFDERSTGVDITIHGSYFSHNVEDVYVWTVDPMNSENNTTRTCFNITKIKNLFLSTYSLLKNSKSKAEFDEVLRQLNHRKIV